MSSVAICDVGVFFEEEGDLFICVQSYPLGYQHRPVLVAAQLDVVGSLQQLLGHLEQHLVLCSTDTRQAGEVKAEFGERTREITSQCVEVAHFNAFQMRSGDRMLIQEHKGVLTCSV